MAGGTLVVSASWLACTPNGLSSASPMLPIRKILVSLQLSQTGAIEVVRSISAWGLSPLQGRIALYAAAGGSRIGCAVHHKVSKEALKKHLREIYGAARAASWDDLSAKLGAIPASHS